MKIDFTQDEKSELLDIIDGFRKVDIEYNELKEKLGEASKKMDKLKEREVILMSILHNKYGEFNIQDISDSIF